MLLLPMSSTSSKFFPPYYQFSFENKLSSRANRHIARKHAPPPLCRIDEERALRINVRRNALELLARRADHAHLLPERHSIFTPCRQHRSKALALHARIEVIEHTQEYVSGDIRMVLHGGRATVNGRRSESSLYDFNLATYETGDTFDQSSSRGFIDIYGLQSKLAAARDVRFGVNMGY